jgi:hypothetical protein
VQAIEQAGKQTDLAVVGRLAQSELQELLRKRTQMNRRIVVLRKTIRALLGNEAVRDLQLNSAIRLTPRKRDGITHICRTVLKQAARPLTARELTEMIRLSQPAEAARHRDLLAAVASVLRYLLESGEANNTFNEEGNRTWFAVRHAGV